jgi:hypothetical protein
MRGSTARTGQADTPGRPAPAMVGSHGSVLAAPGRRRGTTVYEMPCVDRRLLLEHQGARHGCLRQPSGPGELRSRHLSLARLPGTGRPGRSGRSRYRGTAARPGRCRRDRPRPAREPGTAADAHQVWPPGSGGCRPGRRYASPAPGTRANGRRGRPPGHGGYQAGRLCRPRRLGVGAGGRPVQRLGRGCWCSRLGRRLRPECCRCSCSGRRLGRGCCRCSRCSRSGQRRGREVGAGGRPGSWLGRGCWCIRSGRCRGRGMATRGRPAGRGGRLSRRRAREVGADDCPDRRLGRRCCYSWSGRRLGCGCRRCSRLRQRQGRRTAVGGRRGRPPGPSGCRSGRLCRRWARGVGADDCLDRRLGRCRRCGRLGLRRARGMAADDRPGLLPGAGHLAAGHPYRIRTAGSAPAGCPRPPGARRHVLPGWPRRWPHRPRGGCCAIPQAARRAPESRIPPPQPRESHRRRGHSARRCRPGSAGPDRPALPDSPWRERILLGGSHSAVRHFPLS